MNERPNPGPTTRPRAGAEVERLLEAVYRLELIARSNAAGRALGDYRTAIRGRGMDFHEVRPYVPGEPVRNIEWNITARLGAPYVKVHREEREREVVIALDVSPSMRTGFQDRTKLEYAVELAATLTVAARDSGDRIGHVIFADRTLDQGRPRRGRGQFFRTLRAFLDHADPASTVERPIAESDPRAAIHTIESWRRNRLVIFLISDFIDHDLPDDLKYARAHHDLSLLHVYDPLEYATAALTPVRLFAFSPERDGAPSHRSLSPGAAGDLGEIQDFLRQKCSQLRIAFTSCSTAEPVDQALRDFFHRKRSRASR